MPIYIVNQYETHVCSYEIKADTELEAILAVRNGERISWNA